MFRFPTSSLHNNKANRQYLSATYRPCLFESIAISCGFRKRNLLNDSIRRARRGSALLHPDDSIPRARREVMLELLQPFGLY